MEERRLECSDAFSLEEDAEGLGSRGDALRVSSRDTLVDPFALARGEYIPPQAIEFARQEGRVPHDVIGTTHAGLILVSERMREVLRGHGFTGWTSFPVSVTLDEGNELDGYEGLAVTGRCGAIDDSLGEEMIVPAPIPGGRSGTALRGLCFPPHTWDGSDLFTAQGYAGCFVVEPVKTALEQARMTNVGFHRLSEIERIWRADGSVVNSEQQEL